ncbi:hypothetical protein DEU47_11319 [Bacillus sp. AG236]|nr:hypothetical protein DEU47_11319 [Bacillus sp. AG236]
MRVHDAELIRIYEKSNVAVLLVTFIDEDGNKIPPRIVQISGDTGSVLPRKYQSCLDEMCNSKKVRIRLRVSPFQPNF